MVLWVVYHLPLACRRAAVGWTGWRGEDRTRIGWSWLSRGLPIFARRIFIRFEVFLRACLCRCQ